MIQCGNQTMLIDGGDKKHADYVCRYLNDLGIEQIDYAIVTHAHEDHTDGLFRVIDYYPVMCLCTPLKSHKQEKMMDLMTHACNRGAVIEKMGAGRSFMLGEAKCSILGPLRLDYSNENDMSMVLKIEYGETSFLFPGDAGREEEKDLIEAGIDISADVLHVPHHGSDVNNEYLFIRSVFSTRQRFAIISVADNNTYDHPSSHTIDRLQQANVKIYRTDRDRNIRCFSDGYNILFNEEIDQMSLAA